MSFVESCPSTEMRSNERFTHTPSSRSAVSGSSAASVCTKQSIVANAGEIIPAPFACALSRTVPDGSSTSSAAFFGERVGRADRLAERAVAVRARARARACRMPADHLVGVERHADHAGRGDRHAVLGHAPPPSPPAPCMRAASSSPRRPVAAFALPEFATTARMPSSRQRSCVSSTGAASTPERVKRAALTVSGASRDEQAEVAPRPTA